MLNSQQTIAVNVSGHASVIAIPGSGKTHVLCQRASRILNGDATTKIAAVTFSNDSAKELENRINSVVDVAKNRLMVGTFHSFCLKILNSTGKSKLINESEQRSILHNIFTSYGGDKFDDCLSVVDMYKSTFKPDFKKFGYELIYNEYQKFLLKESLIDFADLLKSAVIQIQHNPSLRLNCTHLLVDEFQDTNEIQYQFIMEHAEIAEIMVVSDDDQSIYSFRNALGYSGLKKIEEDLKAKRILLSDNYRCHHEILSAADCVIRNNNNRFEKTLVAAKGEGGSTEIRSFEDIEDESSFIVDEIKKHRNVSWGILARNNKQLDLIENFLLNANIDFYRKDKKLLWDLKIITVYTSLIKSVHDANNFGLIQIFYLMGLNHQDITDLQSLTDNQLIHLPYKSDEITLSKNKTEKINDFFILFQGWRKQTKKNRFILVLQSISHWLKKFCKSDMERSTLDFACNTLSKLKGGLGNRVNATRFLKKKMPDSNIKLMTLHSSKGLEFDHVWMLGLNDKHIPNKESPVQEERRLFYVGMTRARKSLIMSYHEEIPSRFLSETDVFIN
jgi:superfamily I DNA/RNA helicase